MIQAPLFHVTGINITIHSEKEILAFKLLPVDMSVFFFLAFLLPVSEVLTACKPGWVDWAGRCFYMSTGTKNWWDAKQDCIRRGGRLFEPRNKEVNELVYSNVPGPTKCYWIGISDIEHEDKYVYASDDMPIVYSNFRPGYPVSNATKNCFLYACDRSNPFKVLIFNLIY